MKSLTMKKMLAVLMIALLVVSISSVCFASGLLDPGSIQGQSSNASDSIQDISGIILGIVQVIGIAVAVIMLVVLAIKYLSAAPSEKADIKKSAFVYVIGALLLFGGVALLNIIKDAGERLETETGLVVYEKVVYENR